jgi:hypothetical protein
MAIRATAGGSKRILDKYVLLYIACNEVSFAGLMKKCFKSRSGFYK